MARKKLTKLVVKYDAVNHDRFLPIFFNTVRESEPGYNLFTDEEIAMRVLNIYALNYFATYMPPEYINALFAPLPDEPND